MPAQPVTRRKLGMIEIIGWVMQHPEFLHHSARTDIRRDREADEFVQPQDLADII